MIDLENCRVGSLEETSSEQRIQVLERVVLDLMMEIEALRMAVIEISNPKSTCEEQTDVLERSPGGVSGKHTPYGKAYLETAWMTHWSADVTCGWDKLVELFYDSNDERNQGMQPMRELIMLRRLGYDASKIAEYCESARDAETCT